MPTVDDPFRCADAIVDDLRALTPIVIVDVHAEATSEKVALARFLDGRTSAIYGTHTHVQTADEQILPGGTAYITDLGMTGPTDGVIGMEQGAVLDRFLTGLSERFSVQKNGTKQFCAAVVRIDRSTGKATEIKRDLSARHRVIVDFHSHTNQSDGTLTPQALADFMGERRVEIFSISDHDTMTAYGMFKPPAGCARRDRRRDQHDLSRQRGSHPGLRDAGRCAGARRDDRAQSRGPIRARQANGLATAARGLRHHVRRRARAGARRQGDRTAARRQGADRRGNGARYRLGVPSFAADRHAGLRSVAARHAARSDRPDFRSRRRRGAGPSRDGSRIAP